MGIGINKKKNKVQPSPKHIVHENGHVQVKSTRCPPRPFKRKLNATCFRECLCPPPGTKRTRKAEIEIFDKKLEVRTSIFRLAEAFSRE